MNKLLVIIVTYNGSKWLDNCLRSVLQSTVKSDLFIVDNMSTDDTVQRIKNDYPEAILVESAENLGFGKANNVGLKYAVENNYEYVYLLNQDAWVFNDTFEKLIDIYQKHTEYGVLSPMQLSGDLKQLDQNFLVCCPHSMLSDIMCNNTKCLYDPVAKIMAAHWLLPVSIIKKVGGFSPSFPHYSEDHNYLDRIEYFGYKAGIVPDARAVHDRFYRKEKASVTLNKRNLRYLIEPISNPNLSLVKQIMVSPFIFAKCTIKEFRFKIIGKIINFYLMLPTLIKNRNSSKSQAFLN